MSLAASVVEAQIEAYRAQMTALAVYRVADGKISTLMLLL
jgi:hypothetical protein